MSMHIYMYILAYFERQKQTGKIYPTYWFTPHMFMSQKFNPDLSREWQGLDSMKITFK